MDGEKKRMSDTLQLIYDKDSNGEYVVIPKKIFKYIIDYAKNEEGFHDSVKAFITGMNAGLHGETKEKDNGETKTV